jgi:hypothetical protein
LLGKINYLRRFIANLAGKVDSFLPFVRLRNEKDFTWGAEQKKALERIKEYLTTPPVLRAPKTGKMFKLYVVAQEHVIGAVLTQEDDGKEFMVAYISHRLLDAETRYIFVERLYLFLYYAYTKFRHYLLTSMCVVVCQYDIVKYMLHKRILGGRLGKWAYSLVKYDLAYELLRSVKRQVMADFIVDHMIILDEGACLVDIVPWQLFFNGSVSSRGQWIGCIIKSLRGLQVGLSARLEFSCTNNQIEYEACLHGLELLKGMGVRCVEAYDDSKLVV